MEKNRFFRNISVRTEYLTFSIIFDMFEPYFQQPPLHPFAIQCLKVANRIRRSGKHKFFKNSPAPAPKKRAFRRLVLDEHVCDHAKLIIWASAQIRNEHRELHSDTRFLWKVDSFKQCSRSDFNCLTCGLSCNSGRTFYRGHQNLLPVHINNAILMITI